MSYRDRDPKTEAHIEEEQGRRTFLGRVVQAGGLLWGAALAVPVVGFVASSKDEEPPPAEIELGEVGKFEPGSVTKFGFGKKPCFLIVDGKGNMSAVSAVCTHLGCVVQPKGQGFYCACHGGVYDITGKNIGGPPPKPLTKLRVEVADGKVKVFPA